MKNTLITLASVAALATSANAQITSWGAGQYLNFDSVADYVSGNGTAGFTAAGGLRDYSTGGGTGYAVTGAGELLLNGTGPSLGVIAGGNITDFSYDQDSGEFDVQIGAVWSTFAAGDSIHFANEADLLAGTGTFNFNTSTSAFRDYSTTGVGGAIVKSTGGYLVNGTGSPLVPTWIGGSADITDFSVDNTTGAVSVRMGTAGTAVPEPSSTALLGLGVLGLLARRKR